MSKTHKKKTEKIQVSPLYIDYPRQGETITGKNYTFRISAPADVRLVEIAINQGQWVQCRHSSGYWWYDWVGYDDGEHEVITRTVTKSNKIINSEPHEFFVRLENNKN